MGYNTSIAGYILASIEAIIEKYPINYEIHMLQNIQNSYNLINKIVWSWIIAVNLLFLKK